MCCTATLGYSGIEHGAGSTTSVRGKGSRWRGREIAYAEQLAVLDDASNYPVG